MTARLSLTGKVLAMQRTAVKPPAAAARVPVAIVSLYSKPGLAQVHVDVDEARADHLAGGVDDLGARGRLEPAAELVDAPVRDPDVGHRVDAAGRIHHAAVPDQEAHALLLPASR